MKATPDEIQKYLTILRKTTGRIMSQTKHVDKARLQAKPNKDEWSANDILALLRSCAAYGIA